MLQLKVTKGKSYCFIHRTTVPLFTSLMNFEYGIWEVGALGETYAFLPLVVVFIRLSKYIVYAMHVTLLEISSFSGCKCFEAYIFAFMFI